VSVYQGATVSARFLQLWRNGASQAPPRAASDTHLPYISRVYAGAAARQLQVWVRRGNLQRRFHKHGVDGDYGQPGGKKGAPFWYADWEVDHRDGHPNEWELLENIQKCEVAQDFQNNGVATCTITMDNIAYIDTEGPHGLYHLIELGHYSPLRGYSPHGQPVSPVLPNEWFLHNRQALPNAQIMVLMGYGTELVPIFTGLIDDLNPESKPATLVLTARDFGGVLVDQHMFGWAKERQVDRVTFVPKSELEHLKKVGGGASASSRRPGYSPNAVNVVGTASHWESEENGSPDDVEWIEIHLPEGRYSSIYVNPAFAGQDIYVGFYVKPIHIGNDYFHAHWLPDDGSPDLVIGKDNLFVAGHTDGIPFGFFTLHRGLVKDGDPHGEWPWIARRFNTSAKGIRIDLGGTLHTGPDTILRIGVRKLSKRHEKGENPYRAGVTRLLAYKTEPPPKGEDDSQLIPIDDISQIVKILLRWAGFKEWEVEDTGVHLKQRYVLDISKSFMDVINELKDQLGYTFFIAEPTSMDSLGVPVFRNTRILEDTQTRVDLVTEADLLEDVQSKWSNQEERFTIRARGNLLAKSKGGQTLGPDKSFRAQYTYIPPWQLRMAGVIKDLTHYDPKYETATDCQFACYLIATQIALSVLTATIEIPGTPHIGLDSFVRLRDTRTGLNGVRLYVTNRHISFTQGEGSSGGSNTGGEFTTQLGGAVSDTPDIEVIATQYAEAVADLDRNDGP
jgi:hypothetical protein